MSLDFHHISYAKRRKEEEISLKLSHRIIIIINNQVDLPCGNTRVHFPVHAYCSPSPTDGFFFFFLQSALALSSQAV